MNLSPLPIQKFFSNNGRPLAGGKLFTYESGTSTKVATYTSSSGLAQNTNPIILDFRGECRLWIDPEQAYTFVLSPRDDTDPPTDPIWTVDNITAAPLAFDNAAVDTGSVNNISLSIPQITSPVAFTRIVFQVAHTNTGPVTISINGGTANDLVLQNQDALTGAELIEDGIYQAIFDGAQFQLQGLLGIRQTAAEEAAGVFPVNPLFAEGNVIRYGADPTGVADSTTAIQNAISVAFNMQGVAGGFVYLAAGQYKTTATLIFGSRINMYGDGIYASAIVFAPTGTDTCIEVSNGSGRVDQGSLRNFAVYASETTHTKIGIDLLNVGSYVIDSVLVSGPTGACWGGNGDSICLRTRGRDTTEIANISLFGDRPLVIAPNPNEPSISIDHFVFRNLYMLGGTSYPLVEIQDGVILTQVSFTGYQAWVGGGPGLQWIDTTSATASNGLVIYNPRFEQGADITAYMFDIDMNVALQGFQVYGGQGGDRRGFKLRSVESVEIHSFQFQVALEGLNIDSSVRRICGFNCFWQAGSTKTVTGQRLDFASPLDPNTGTLPPHFIYNQTANADDQFNIGVQTTFTATLNGYTIVLGGGTVTTAGRYYKLGKRVWWNVIITAAGGATIASTANTSFISGMPANTVRDTLTVVKSDATDLGIGLMDSGALTPTWAAQAGTFIVSGSYEIA